MDILDYLEANYLTVTLQSTADHFGFHPNYLSAFIKKETGRTFKELVILQKMCQACFYLTNTDSPSTKSHKRSAMTILVFSTGSSLSFII